MFCDVHRLIERCILRDEKAWGEFVDRFSGLLYYSARERLSRNGFAFGQEDLEDIVQGIFVEILDKGRLEEVQKREKITARLSIMAQTRALNYIARKRERLLDKKEFYRIENIKEERGASNDLYDEKTIKGLRRRIESFDAREKIIFKLNIVHGKTHKEIARFMKVPINTVSTIIARKKKVLKEEFKNF